MNAVCIFMPGLLLVGIGVSGNAMGQDVPKDNIYRYILGVDVPGAPAFVALGVAPTHVLRGSAPKPLEASILHGFTGDAPLSGVAVGAAPYFLVGGGDRPLPVYRSGTIGGRLMRVLTKTLVSFGAVRMPGDPASTFVGLGVRSTLHDPHDPVMNSTLPEDVAALLQEQGVSSVAGTEEDVTDYGVDLAPAFARARRAMRARVGGGDPQVSGGWGMAGRLRGSTWHGDSLGTMHHNFWISAQITVERRFDVLTTVQVRDAFDARPYAWLGAGLQRKTALLDLITALYYDTGSRSFYPEVALDTRLFPNLGLVASLTTQATPDPLVRTGPRQIALRAVVQWFYASDK